jgi:hypothetical protein
MNVSRLIPLVLVGVAGPAVQAVTLPPYPAQVALPGTSLAAQPHLAGTVVEDLLTPFAYTLEHLASENSYSTWDVTGTVQSQVVRAVDGTFDFYWRVLPDAQYEHRSCSTQDIPVCIISTQTSPTVHLSDFHVGSFNVPEVRANWRSDGPGEAAPRTGGLESGLNPTINFHFGEFAGGEFYTNSTLRTGIDSYFLFIDTDARAYSKSGVFSLSSQDELYFGDARGFGGRSQWYATFAPAPIPEPQTWALMLAGLAGLAGLSRRRRA